MTRCSIIIRLSEQLVFAPINTRRLVMFVIGKWISLLPTTVLVEGWFLKPATPKDGRTERGEG
jgi:hypothetical protein